MNKGFNGHFVASFLLFLLLPVRAQQVQGVGIGVIYPDPTAILHVEAEGRGVLLPQLSEKQKQSILNPAHGLIIWNSSTQCMEAYDSIREKWFAFSCPMTCSPCSECLNPIITFVSGAQDICPGSEYSYYVISNGGRAIFWMAPSHWRQLVNGDTTRFVAGHPGWLKVAVCNECGCSIDSIYANIGAPPTDTPIILLPSQVCNLDTIMVLGAYMSPTTAMDWIWQVDSPLSVLPPVNNDTILVVLPDSSGALGLSLQVCNGCGCSPIRKTTIQVKGPPEPTTLQVQINPDPVCPNDIVQVIASGNNVHGWAWFVPPNWGLISNNLNDTIYVRAPASIGTDTFLLQACNDCGCTSHIPVPISVQGAPPSPTVRGPNSACIQDTIVLVASSPGATTWSWTLPSGWVPLNGLTNDTLIALTGNASGTHSLSVIACSPCGCSSPSFHTVSLSDGPSLSVNGPTTICPNATVSFSASGSGIISWNWLLPSGWTPTGPITNSTLTAIAPSSVGTYTIQVRGCDQCGCTTASYPVTVSSSSPTVSISGPPTVCPGDTVVYNANGSGITSWTWTIPLGWTPLGPTNSSSVSVVAPLSPGTSVIRVQGCDSCGCSSDSLIVNITGSPAPPNISGPSSVCLDDTVILIASGSYSTWTWTIPAGWTAVNSPADDTLIVVAPSNSDTAIFTVQGCGSCGCNSSNHTIVSRDTCQAMCFTFGGNWSDGEVGLDRGANVTSTSDGGFMIATRSVSFGGIYLIKLDQNLNVHWAKSLNYSLGGAQSGYEEAWEIEPTPDGNYAIWGIVDSAGKNADFFVAKVDINGNVLMERAIDTRGWEVATDGTITTDGGYVLIGHTNINSYPEITLMIAKISSTGNLQWSKIYPSRKSLIAIDFTDIKEFNGNLVALFTNIRNTDTTYLLGIDPATGNVLWAKAILSTDPNSPLELHEMLVSSDGSLVLAGQYGGDMAIIKLNGSYNVVWARQVGTASLGEGGVTKIIESSTGDYVVIGGQTNGSSAYLAYLVAMTPSGNLSWTRSIAHSSTAYDYRPGGIAENSGKIIVTGSMRGIRGGDVFISRVYLNGEAGTPCTNCYNTSIGSSSPISVQMINVSFSAVDIGSLRIPNHTVNSGGTQQPLCP
ncbi:MAG: hypothetical protein GXO48_02395 [Chlorobi bacterium]|nr:hypothetical protein [Chlorobiota bacterium]